MLERSVARRSVAGKGLKNVSISRLEKPKLKGGERKEVS